MSSYRLHWVGYLMGTIALATIFVAWTTTKKQSSFRTPPGTRTVGSKRFTPPSPVGADRSVGEPRTIVAAYGRLPLAFEANQGQTDRRVKFLSRGNGYTLFLTSDEAVLELKKERPQSRRDQASLDSQLAATNTSPAEATEYLRMKLVGANSQSSVSGVDELAGNSNYFIGNDPNRWQTNVPHYGKVKYTQVYPGVDLVYYGNQRQLEYDFILAPDVDPQTIRLGFGDAEKLRIDQQGALVLETKGGDLRFEPPQLYQEVAGKRRKVEGRYSLIANRTVGFEVAN